MFRMFEWSFISVLQANTVEKFKTITSKKLGIRGI